MTSSAGPGGAHRIGSGGVGDVRSGRSTDTPGERRRPGTGPCRPILTPAAPGAPPAGGAVRHAGCVAALGHRSVPGPERLTRDFGQEGAVLARLSALRAAVSPPPPRPG